MSFKFVGWTPSNQQRFLKVLVHPLLPTDQLLMKFLQNLLIIVRHTQCQYLQNRVQCTRFITSSPLWKSQEVPVQINTLNTDPEIEKQLAPLRAKIKEQGDLVRQMKADGASEINIRNQVRELKSRRKELEDMALKLYPQENFDRNEMNDIIRRRFFYDNSFAIYGGIKGQFDYGPVGCDLIDNMLAEWKRHFVVRDQMLKVNCSTLTPKAVLKASGHVDKFCDYVVKDVKTTHFFRLDHLIKDHFEKIIADLEVPQEEKDIVLHKLKLLDSMTMKEMNNIVKEYGIKSPSTGNDLTDAEELNLMYPISIGQSEPVDGFLRPETAQGIFVNFKRLLEYNQGKLPFACAQVGNAYRNEIACDDGLLRVREFTMAEIEHFCYPDDKSHPKFHQVADTEMVLYSACAQMDGESPKLMTINEAVREGLVANETLGYYMARIQQYLLKIGINPTKLRFRQHLGNEMAHYACDCWDAECSTTYGWIECAGCADRNTYDLSQHTIGSGVQLTVENTSKEPKISYYVIPFLDKRAIKKTFKKDAKIILEALASLSNEVVDEMDEALKKIGEYTLNGFTVTRAMVPKFLRKRKEVRDEEIIPCVIEPSFGIGRIFYCLLEHTCWTREEDLKRTYFAFPTIVAPFIVSILPLSKKVDFIPFVSQIAENLSELNLSVKVGDSDGDIGKRYALSDELGIPFGITVDYDTLNSPHSITLRERNSTDQVQMPMKEVPLTIQELAAGKIQWKDIAEKYPKYVFQRIQRKS